MPILSVLFSLRLMSSKLRLSARKSKINRQWFTASDKYKDSQRVTTATSVPAPQLPTVDALTIPTTTSAEVYPLLYTNTGPGFYTDVCSPQANPECTADTLLYSRELIQNKMSTASSQDYKEHSLGNGNIRFNKGVKLGISMWLQFLENFNRNYLFPN